MKLQSLTLFLLVLAMALLAVWILIAASGHCPSCLLKGP